MRAPALAVLAEPEAVAAAGGMRVEIRTTAEQAERVDGLFSAEGVTAVQLVGPREGGSIWLATLTLLARQFPAIPSPRQAAATGSAATAGQELLEAMAAPAVQQESAAQAEREEIQE